MDQLNALELKPVAYYCDISMYTKRSCLLGGRLSTELAAGSSGHQSGGEGGGLSRTPELLRGGLWSVKWQYGDSWRKSNMWYFIAQ